MRKAIKFPTWICWLLLTWGSTTIDAVVSADVQVDEGRPGALRSSTSSLHRADNQDDDRVLSWEELDALPLPAWYDQGKFGIFLHWGVFSVPSLCSEWMEYYWRTQSGPCPWVGQIINATERPKFAYEEYAPRFQAELFNATDWSDAFPVSGAQYVVLTSKHHDGYTMWDSRRSVPTTWHWNVMDVGPRRDLLGELAKAVKNSSSPHTGEKLKFGVYHSLYEWFNPMFWQDQQNNFTTDDFVTMKTLAELKDLVKTYEPELIWSDGDWSAKSDYWRAREFLSWYSKTIKTGIWNDRWGSDCLCKHGGFLTCADRYEPGKLVQNNKWENAMTIDKSSWGYNRASPFENYLTTKELVDTLIETVAYNGNLLLNVGPSADGTIDPIFLDRLRGIGEWLGVNGQAIYQTRPWDLCQSEHPKDRQPSATDSTNEAAYSVYYTRTTDALYVHLTKWPSGSHIQLDCPEVTEVTQVSLLGYEHMNSTLPRLALTTGLVSGKGVAVDLPLLTPDVLLSRQPTWVLRMTSVANLDDKPFGDSNSEKA